MTGARRGSASHRLARAGMGAAAFLLAANLRAAQVTEFTLTQANSSPYGITLGPDGNIWFTEQVGNRIGRITPAGVLTEFLLPNPESVPQFITAGSDGNLWFTEYSGQRIGRITPAGVITEFPIPSPEGNPEAIAAGPDGAIWYTQNNPPKIGRITASGHITEFPVPGYGLPLSITTGPDANLWITVLLPPAVLRMTPQGSVTAFPLPTSFLFPTEDAFQIIAGPGGDLWFTNRLRHAVGRISVEGVLTTEAVGGLGLPFGITRGPDGAIWVSQGDRISEISPRLGVRDYAIGAAGFAGFIAAGLDGAMWVTRPGDNKVLRVQFAAVVNDAGDDLHPAGCAATGQGTCTLRDALTWSNALPGPETIHFAIPGPGVKTITPASALPFLDDVSLDATTQPGFAGLPLVELVGTNAGAASGLVAAGGTVGIRGFIVNRFSADGIRIEGALRSVVQANFVGTDASGTVAAPNTGSGIRAMASLDNLVGGSTAADRNVVSGNGMEGVHAGSNTRVIGNFIGLDRTGTVPLGNSGDGVLSSHSSTVQVGAPTAIPGVPPGNVISANGGAGVRSFVFSGGSSGQLTILGNWIGTNTAGKASLGNAEAGVHLQGARDCIVGGAEPGAANVIAGNSVGVRLGDAGLQLTASNVVSGNFIGTDPSGTIALGNLSCGVQLSDSASSNRVGEVLAPNRIAFNGTGGVCATASVLPSDNNTISANAIYSNGGLGIDLAPTGPNGNDPCDADAGANGLQNHPLLTSVRYGPGTTIVQGTLEAAPSSTFRLEFFRNAACDPSGSGEGLAFLGEGTVVTDASCLGVFEVVLPSSVGPAERITATATDPAGNTSEFSPCFALAGMKFSTLVPCRIADTREPPGPFGGPSIAAGETRTLAIAGRCVIPASARAVAVNATAVGAQSSGHLVLFPAGQPIPVTSTLNYRAGQARANNAILPLSVSGELSVHCAQAAGSVDLLLDVVGYFD